MTNFEIYGRNGHRIAGGIASLSEALRLANLYPSASKIVRSQPFIVSQKDHDTGLWSAPDEWPNESGEAQ